MKVQWTNLVEETKSWPISLQTVNYNSLNTHYGLRMIHKEIPISISEHEFNFMRDFVQNLNPKECLEIATGIGVSTLAIALGLKDGYLTTIDSYEEEDTQIQPQNSFKKNQKNPDGLLMAQMLARYFEVQDKIEFIHDIYDGNVLPDGKWDFIFLDCPKNDEDFIKIFELLLPYIDNRTKILVHDTHTHSGKSKQFVEAKGWKWANVLSEQHYPLVLIER
jgi:predicted O-methyltransferase YrrM